MALSTTKDCDRTLGSELISLFESDPKWFLIYLDCGFTDLKEFFRGLNSRALNAGICEQAAVSIASGMALSGLRPIVYGIASFLVFRAFEQIRLDLVDQRANVKLIGIGAGEYFKHLGVSHITGMQDQLALSAINMPCYRYGSEAQYDGFDPWHCFPGPAYLRVT